MRSLLFFTLFFAAASPAACAQSSSDAGFAYPKHQFKASLMDMIDPFAPAFMLSYEHFVNDDMSLLAEGGLVSSFDGTWINRKDLYGYKIRGELRYYFNLDSEVSRAYIGLQGMYRHVTRATQLGTFCRLDCAYFQMIDYNFVKNVGAGHISLGYSAALTKHVVMDLGGFGGLRYVIRSYAGVPDDAVLIEEDDVIDFSLDESPGEFLIPSIGFALRFGFGW